MQTFVPRFPGHLLFRILLLIALLPHTLFGLEFSSNKSTHSIRTGKQKKSSTTSNANKKWNINRISVYGERNSCTTMISRILENNFRINCGDDGRCIGPWKMWKHDFFRQALKDVDYDLETLHLFVTRHPYEWLHSMWKRPHYADAHDNLDFDTFLTRQWRSYIDIRSEKRFSNASVKKLGTGLSDDHSCVNLSDRVRKLKSPGSSCRYSNKTYFCMHIPGWYAQRGEYSSPSLNCISGHHSMLVCSDGKYLCLVGTRIEIPKCDGEAKQALMRVGGLCSWNNSHFECVPDSDGANEHCGQKFTELCPTGYVLCRYGTERVNAGDLYPQTSNRQLNRALTMSECAYLAHPGLADGRSSVMGEIGGMCRHDGRFFRCAISPHRAAAAGDGRIPALGCLSGDESAAICEGGGYLCEHDVRLDWDPPYVFMAPLLPCHPRARDAVRAPGGGCLFGGRVYVCRRFENATVQQGTEPSPSPVCRNGAESWGLCDQGAFLCEEEPVAYPPDSSRHGLVGHHVPRCDAWPTDALREIGALCRYLGRNYACVQFPGRNAAFGDLETPYVRCLSGDQSIRLCQHGKYLCEQGVNFDAFWAGSGGRPPECGLGAREILRANGTCLFEGQRYSCERVRYHRVVTGLERSPFSQCRSGSESFHLCSEGMFLCVEPPECANEADSRSALARIGGSCRRGQVRYSCQDLRGRSLDLSFNSDVPMASKANLNGCLSFLRSLCPEKYALCSHRLASMEPYPLYSSRSSIPGITIPLCENGTAEVREVGGQCLHLGKSYQCIPFAGQQARMHDETRHSEYCLSGHESCFVCSFGRFLCESIHVNYIKMQVIALLDGLTPIPSTMCNFSHLFSTFSRPMQSPCPDISTGVTKSYYLPGNIAFSASIIAGISNVPYPPNSSRFGIEGICVPSCVELPRDELRKIGSICHHEGEFYGCVIVPGRHAIPQEWESPHEYCFSGDSSSFLCDNGRYLCKDGYLFPWLLEIIDNNPSQSACLLQCGIQSRLALALNQTCIFEGLRYRCEEVPQFRVESGLEESPSNRCRSGTESWGLCSDGKFLCALNTTAISSNLNAQDAVYRRCNDQSGFIDCQSDLSLQLYRVDGNDSVVYIGDLNKKSDVSVTSMVRSNLTLLKLSKPLPCELITSKFMSKSEDVCIHEDKYYQCKNIPGKRVLTGLESSPSNACVSATESWGLCENGKFLCEETQILYPSDNMLYRLGGQYVPRCDAFPVDELEEIGGLCRHGNRNYRCTHVPGEYANITERRSPDGRCFSGSQSSALCTKGRFLCEDSNALPWLCSKTDWTGSRRYMSKCPLLCGQATQESLAREGSCNFDGRIYRCELLRRHRAKVGVLSPTSRCASGTVSILLCDNGTFLCTEPPNCLDIEAAAIALREISGVCTHNAQNYMCQHIGDPESSNSTLAMSSQLNGSNSIINRSDCLQSISHLICYPRHILCAKLFPSAERYPSSTNRYEITDMYVPRCSEVTYEMQQIGSICEHLGRNYKCIDIVGRIAFSAELESPSAWCLSGKESAPFCSEGQYMCQDWIQQPWQVSVLNPEEFPPCIMPMLESIRAAASTCSFQGKVYSCRLITGSYVYTGLERGPGAICRNGAESWNFCTEGRFLCETIPPCSGAGAFALADLGGVCWSSKGLHQCLKLEHTYGVNEFESAAMCHNDMFPSIICKADEFLCLVNTTVKVPHLLPQKLENSNETCPLDDMMRLRMVGGVCQLYEKNYECIFQQSLTPKTRLNCSDVEFGSILCPENHLLCPANSIKSTGQADDQKAIWPGNSGKIPSLTPCHKSNRDALKAPDSGCYLEGKNFKCKSIPGYVAAESDFQSPCDGCKSGVESVLLCTNGRFLCEADRHYRWERDTHETYLANFEEPSDRHPDTQMRFPNIMAMRTAKLKDWLLYSKSKNFSYHISCRDFLLNPEEVLGDIEAKFNLDRLHNNWILDTCIWRFGLCQHFVDDSWNSSANVAKRRYYQSGKHLEHFSSSNLKLIAKNLDPVLERKFGYRIFENKQEAQTVYDQISRCLVHWPGGVLWSRKSQCGTKLFLYRLAAVAMQRLTAPFRGLWMLVRRASTFLRFPMVSYVCSHASREMMDL